MIFCYESQFNTTSKSCLLIKNLAQNKKTSQAFTVLVANMLRMCPGQPKNIWHYTKYRIYFIAQRGITVNIYTHVMLNAMEI